MKTLYLDIFSGISGDMFVGALLDLGVNFEKFQSELGKLHLAGFHLHVRKAEKCGIQGTKFDVHMAEDHHHEHDEHHDHDHHHPHDHGHSHSHTHSQDDPLARLLTPLKPSPAQPHVHGRGFAEIRTLINSADYSHWVKEKAIAIFSRIARAEGKIHGKPPDEVHFHEVGAIDSIVDILGACIGLELLGKPRILASPVVEGHGFVRCAHGQFPIPAPATLAILTERGTSLSQCDEPHELVTPTGAAILAEFVETFGHLPNLTPERIGYGLGTRDNRTRPNVLRAILGRANEEAAKLDWETDTITVLETNLDDIPSEMLGHFMEIAFREGALDVFHTPIQMKKNRPGVLLSVLCPSDKNDHFAELILRHTTAFGIRTTNSQRRKLQRKSIEVKTCFGGVQVKLGTLNGKVLQASPEFESCKALAETHGVPIKNVFDAARAASIV
jgi:uncharacterized protein (TIGR00299 family) protein